MNKIEKRILQRNLDVINGKCKGKLLVGLHTGKIYNIHADNISDFRTMADILGISHQRVTQLLDKSIKNLSQIFVKGGINESM